MKKLSYQTLKELNYDGYLLESAPERVLQFGEGNFLRAFVDYFIERWQDSIPKSLSASHRDHLLPILSMNRKDCIRYSWEVGFQDGQKINKKRVISCISRCLNARKEFDAVLACASNPELRFIVGNTTEAGIAYDPSCQFTDCPASSYPGKLTQFLYRRFEIFGKTAVCNYLKQICEKGTYAVLEALVK